MKMKIIVSLLTNILLYAILLLFSVSMNAQKVWTGTGFALNNGYLVTNWHVADGAQTIHVYGVRGDFTKKYIAEVVAKDKINDLAILKISDNGFPGFGTVPYKIRTGTAEVAEEVFALGYPMTEIMGDELKYTDGRISSLSGFDGDVSTYQISAPVQPGNSGGPLLDDNGNVIGIVCAKIDNRIAQNVNYAVKASYLKNLVETMQINNVLPENSQMENYAQRQDKVKTIRNYVFYIECYGKDDGETFLIPVAQSDYIDLGLPSGTLWKNKNEIGFYDYDAAVRSFCSKLPTEEQFKELINSCQWIWMGSGYKIVGPSGASILLPTVGYRDCDESVCLAGSIGNYWSSTRYGSDGVCCLVFISGKIDIFSSYLCFGRSVRLVCNKKE